MSGDPVASSESAPVRAWRCPLAGLVLCSTFAAGLSFDLWTKYWSFENVAPEPVALTPGLLVENPDYRLPWHPGVEVVPPDLLDFHLVLNRGAVFGIGQHRRGVFIALTVVAVVAGLAVFAGWTDRRSRLSHVAIGLVLAGGVGNLYDRFLYGAVRDFLHMLPRRHLPFDLAWPGGSTELFPWVFNVADVLLLAGMALLMFQAYRADRSAAREARESGVASRSSGPSVSGNSSSGRASDSS
ncbi:MAG: signal peptidase II [Phycisphaerales bacterium]